jgi:hypothetical protein
MVVKVKANKLSDGSLLALEIEVKDRLNVEGKLLGPITAINGNVIDVIKLPVLVVKQTILQGFGSISELAVNKWVKVHYRLLPDGTRIALKVKVESTPSDDIQFSGVIDSLMVKSLIVEGVPVQVTDTTKIVRNDTLLTFADLKVGLTVNVRAILSSGNIIARRIKIESVKTVTSTIDSLEGGGSMLGKRSGIAVTGTITLAGQKVTYDDQTLIVGTDNSALSVNDIRVGAFIEVIAFSSVAQKIEVKQAGATPTYQSNSNKIIPKDFVLEQNYPNPFNPTTYIPFVLNQNSKVKLEIYNVLGQKIAILIDGRLKSGYHKYKWDGNQMASGIYFYKLVVGKNSQIKKMVLIK